MTEDELFDASAKRIEEYDHTTMAELARLFPEHYRGGNLTCEREGMNIVFWAGMTETGVAVYQRLAATYVCLPTSYFIYFLDGITLKFPIAKRAREYKKLHWLPVMFRKHKKPKQGAGK